MADTEFSCPEFTSKFSVPLASETASCGLCKLYEWCKLPQKRNPNNNGRTQYRSRPMDTEAAEYLSNPRRRYHSVNTNSKPGGE